MKQVFECGITGQSNDEVGDCLLGRLAGIPMPDTNNRKLPDDFTLEVPECDIVRDPSLIDKYQQLCEAMMERGYEVIRWHDMDRWCDCVRFRRVKP